MIRRILHGGHRPTVLRAVRALLLATLAAAVPATLGVTQASAASFTSFTPLASTPLTAGTIEPSDTTPGPQYGTFGQYGQVASFGGFDTCWFDGGGYDGQGFANSVSGCTANESAPTPGLLMNAQGFAVDPVNDDVYVIDRTSAATGATSWRLQELSGTGTVLGTDMFNLPADYQMTGLAVDHSTGIVYSLVDYYTGTTDIPYAVVAWSTTPGSHVSDSPYGGQLSAPTGLQSPTGEDATDAAQFTAAETSAAVAYSPAYFGVPGIVSNDQQLAANTTDPMYNPQGLAVNDQSGGADDLVIEASTVNTSPSLDDPDGPTIVQQLASCGSSSCSSLSGLGVEGGDWLSSSLASDPNAVLTESGAFGPTAASGPAGISTNPDGSLTVLLVATSSGGGYGVGGSSQGGYFPANLTVVNVSENLTGAGTILASPVNAAGGQSRESAEVDEAAIDTDSSDPPFAVNNANPAWAAGPQIVGLSNGLYAADYAGQPGDDGQPGVTGKYYWFNPTSYSGTAAQGTGNEATRLLEPEAAPGQPLDPDTDPLSNASVPLTSVYDTLGNATSGGACNLAQAGASYAAGADGALFMLVRGFDTTHNQNATTGRQIVELAPVTGSTDACPTASGTFTVTDPNTDGGAAQTASTTGTPVTVGVGDMVTFDAGGIDYPTTALGAITATNRTATPFAYEWDPGDGGTIPPVTTDATTADWPSPTQTYTYTKTGVYTAQLTLLGDYGRYVQDSTVDVEAASPPTAALASTSVSGTVNQPVSLNASGSQPASGASIINYHWDCGNGQTFDTTSPTETCTYSTPNTYKVTLTVRDNDTQVSALATETVNITDGAPTVSVTASPTSATTGQSVSFTGTATAGAGSSITGYSWNFGDGQTANTTTGTTTHAYAAAGTYTVTLTVTDADKQTATSTTTVTVTAPAQPAGGGGGGGGSAPKTTPLKLTPSNDVLKAGVTSTSLVLQVKSLKSGTKLSVKLSEPGARAAKAKSAKVGAKGVIRFATGKLPVGKTTIRFYETVGKGKKAKLKLVKTETIHVSKKKK